MEDKKIKRAKDLFITYLGSYYIYNKAKYPDALLDSFFIGKSMLMGFVCELGIKALILQNGKKCEKKHYLDELFDLISPENKKFIIQGMKLEESEFYEKLSKNKNIFVEWRYFTEDPSSCSADTSFIDNLIVIMEFLLLEDSYKNRPSQYFIDQIKQI